MNYARLMCALHKNRPGSQERFGRKHRIEHWYRDNSVYFITARCRERFRAFASDQAKQIFWDRFTYYASQAGFVPIVTTLLDNHYHALGYLEVGKNLGSMMQKIHGSVAKLVNDTLTERLLPFWRDSTHCDYFDGCIRDEVQLRRAYRYVLTQSVRHGICSDRHLYPHTRVTVELESAVRRAKQLRAFLEDVPYARYQRRRSD